MSDRTIRETPVSPKEYGFSPFCTCEHCRKCMSGRPWLAIESLPQENTRRLLEFRDRSPRYPVRILARDWDGSRGYVRKAPGVFWVFSRRDAEQWFDAWRPLAESEAVKRGFRREESPLAQPVCPDCQGSGCLPGSQGHACDCGAHDEDQATSPTVGNPAFGKLCGAALEELRKWDARIEGKKTGEEIQRLEDLILDVASLCLGHGKRAVLCPQCGEITWSKDAVPVMCNDCLGGKA